MVFTRKDWGFSWAICWFQVGVRPYFVGVALGGHPLIPMKTCLHDGIGLQKHLGLLCLDASIIAQSLQETPCEENAKTGPL